jgi:hypothetical protein
MSPRFAVVHEAEADFHAATELADRVLSDGPVAQLLRQQLAGGDQQPQGDGQIEATRVFPEVRRGGAASGKPFSCEYPARAGRVCPGSVDRPQGNSTSKRVDTTVSPLAW